MPLRIARYFVLALSLLAAGCGSKRERAVRVGEHTFLVPSSHLLDVWYPWLPASQANGLKFIVNTDDPLTEQIIVGVEPAGDICRPELASAQSETVRRTCSAAAKRAAPDKFDPLPLRKIYPNPSDPTQWGYYAMEPGGRSIEISYCTPGNGQGLCNFVGHYSDLFYTVGLGERRISQVSEVRRRVESLLAQWEKA
jgi:hypothetical protein